MGTARERRFLPPSFLGTVLLVRHSFVTGFLDISHGGVPAEFEHYLMSTAGLADLNSKINIHEDIIEVLGEYPGDDKHFPLDTLYYRF